MEQYYFVVISSKKTLHEQNVWTELWFHLLRVPTDIKRNQNVFLQTCTILNLLFECQRLIAIFYVSSPWCRMYNNFLREGTPKLFWNTLIFVITRYHCRHIRGQSEAIRRCREYLWKKEIKFSIFFQALLISKIS